MRPARYASEAPAFAGPARWPPCPPTGITSPVARVCREGGLRHELVTAVRDRPRAVPRDLGAERF
ncbi:hypothetical protein ACFY2M_09095 [Streptomyces sp. NPDC001276]|uniref:hypothetical protein n=1 Tax=Streptomyces sp. NPDC001276 TaxID=3364555 RepID=UPI0036A69938